MPQRLRVYISGPLTSSGNQLDNVAVAIDAARELIRLGYSPLCPHLTYYIDPDAAIAHQVWMEVDLPWVRVCSAVLRLAGDSKGAEMECQEAHLHGIPVFHSINDLHSVYSGR